MFVWCRQLCTGIYNAKAVYWKDHSSVKVGRQEFTGVPFVVLGQKKFDCQHGPDRKKKVKESKLRKVDGDHTYKRGKKFLMCPSKKLDCPAQVIMRELCFFPIYKVSEESGNTCHIGGDLKWRLARNEVLPHEKKIIVCLPDVSAHFGHDIDLESLDPQPIDKALSEYIKSLVEDGVTDTGLVRVQLAQKVKDLMTPLPNPRNTKYYPTEKTIRNHIYRAKKDRLANDEINLKLLIKDIEASGDYCHMRLKTDESVHEKNGKFLFVYQSKEQRRLLERYGDMVFMDATYKTSLYSLPLFFLGVKTNVDYQVVGAFVTEDECTSSIEEALEILHRNCFPKKPVYFLTDFDEREINAIQRVFEGTEVLICDFHRNQAWERWTTKKENSHGLKDEIMSYLMRMANARTLTSFEIAEDELRSSRIFTSNNKLQHYLDRVWLPHKNRWSKAYRCDCPEIIATTNNGLESQFKMLKNYYLHKKTSNSLYCLLKVIVKDFLPSRYKEYTSKNIKFSGTFRTVSEELPEQLKGRPLKFVKSCMKYMEEAKDIERHNINTDDGHTYQVLDSGKLYNVTLGDQNTFPSCNCSLWIFEKILCKHMFAVLQLSGQMNWEQMSPKYMASVYNVIDETLLNVELEPSEDTETREDLDETLLNVDLEPSEETKAKEDTDETLLNVDLETSEETKAKEDTDDKKSIHDWQLACRDQLKLLIQQSYITEDKTRLKDLHATLVNLTKDFVPSGNKGLPEPTRKLNRKRPNSISRRYHKKKSLKINEGILREEPTTVIYGGNVPCKDDSFEVLGGETDVTVPPCLPEHFLREYEELISLGYTNNFFEMDGTRHVGPYSLSRESFECIDSLLSDEVMDAFLHELVTIRANTFHINCVTWTSIFEGRQEIHHCLRQVESLMDFDTIIGAYNQSGCHWCLIAILPRERQIVYINPLGTLLRHEQDIILKWFNFMKCRRDAGLESELTDNWTLHIPPHAKQMDGSSCGIYVLKFAENFLLGKPLFFYWTNGEVMEARRSLACFLFQVSRPTEENENSARSLGGREGMQFDEDSVDNVGDSCMAPGHGDDAGSFHDTSKGQNKDEKRYSVRKRIRKRQRSSFVYTEVKKGVKKVYCKCNKPYDGSFMVQCDSCLQWYHPSCLGLEDIQEEEPFLCTSCLDCKIPQWLKDLFEEDDVREEFNNFFFDHQIIPKHMPSALYRILAILQKNPCNRNQPWMKRSVEFGEDTVEETGYGFAVFSQQAILSTIELLKAKFFYQEKQSLFDSAGRIRGLKDSRLLKSIKQDKHLAGIYLKRVLLPEALCAMLQNRTGIGYHEADKMCSVTIRKSKREASLVGIAQCRRIKEELCGFEV